MKTLTCPSCGRRGEVEDGNFEARGRSPLGGLAVKCRQCGSGLSVKPRLFSSNAKAEKIPPATWKKMEVIWQREVGDLNGEGFARDPYTDLGREAIAAAGFELADTDRVSAYVVTHPNCMPSEIAAALDLSDGAVGFHVCSAVAQGLISPGEISDDALRAVGLTPPT